MTRKEAIRILKGGNNHECTWSEYCEAYNMAIKALEQEPKTEKVIQMRDATPEERELINKYIKSISKPTGIDFWNLEQEPKTGHWIFHSGAVYDEYICSNCNKRHADYATNYCPNCGADMREVVKE